MLIEKVSDLDFEAGCDEAGRGCLAGPVVAGAVILPKGFKNELLNDSKKLTEKSRNYLRKVIEQEAISFGVGIVEPQKIDEINILNASFLAMHLALKKLKPQPKFIAVDGNRFNPYGKTPFECVVKGDGKVMNIAAASILAKTYRDGIMERLHNKYSQYDWAKNKGYPTKKHREAIAKNGATPHHRMSFQLLPNQLKLQL